MFDGQALLVEEVRGLYEGVLVRYGLRPAEFNAWKDRLGDDGIVLFGFADAICFPAGHFSPEDFSLLWVDAPDAFMELIRVANERLCEQAELCCQAGIDAFRFLGLKVVDKTAPL